jgi:hypothetical protein
MVALSWILWWVKAVGFVGVAIYGLEWRSYGG